MSPQLGIHANRDSCEVDAVGAVGDRLTIHYFCSMGRFDWAEKEFQLLCALRDGAMVCARALTVASYNLHTGGKSEHTTDVVHDTLSCAPHITRDRIALAATPASPLPDVPHVREPADCGPGVELSAPITAEA